MSFIFFDILPVFQSVILKNDIKRGIVERERERERVMVIKRVQKIATQS